MTDPVTDVMNLEEKKAFEQFKGKFPFLVIEFANALGINVFATKMPTNQSGAISKVDNEYVIRVNEDHCPRRIRFTLAHELGHYFNDKAYLEENSLIVDDSKHSERGWLFRKHPPQDDPTMRKMDIRANQFAAELLMPERKFIEIWHSKTSLHEVSDFFNVSIDAVKIRAASVLGEII